MNLPQLIEWAKNNEIKNRMVLTKDSYCVGFDRHGYIYFNSTLTMPLNQVFTVEVEEEITEDTKLYLVERYISSYENSKFKYKSHQNNSINSVLKNNMPHLITTHFYTEVNNELVLIWKNGKLVE